MEVNVMEKAECCGMWPEDGLNSAAQRFDWVWDVRFVCFCLLLNIQITVFMIIESNFGSIWLFWKLLINSLIAIEVSSLSSGFWLFNRFCRFKGACCKNMNVRISFGVKVSRQDFSFFKNRCLVSFEIWPCTWMFLELWSGKRRRIIVIVFRIFALQINVS